MPDIDPPHADGREPETAPPVGVFSDRTTATDTATSGHGPAGPPKAGPGGKPGPARPRRRVLVVTNDFPPRLGGIQSFVYNAVCGLPADEVVVYSSTFPGAAEFDAAQPFRVIRDPRAMLLPTPAVRARVLRARAQVGATAIWFGAAAPLGLLAPALRRAGAERLVATTHGHEVGWAALPAARALLRRIGRSVDVVTYLGDYTRARLAAVLGSGVELARLAPGVDTDTFADTEELHAAATGLRERYGLGAAPVVVCVSRLVRRKGQDSLIAAWPAVRARVPGARLLLVGRGPYEPDLRRQAVAGGVEADVVFAGGVPDDELAAHVAVGDVFAMPCRTRRRGLDVEGLGIVYLEAGACSRAVVAGDSGGAPDAVRNGETGFVVDGRDVDEIADRVSLLLGEPELRARMGRAGREWVTRDWRWPQVSAALDRMLQG
jgi:phosphatidyl-myo-inositol dimannoside synthase